MPEEEGNKPIRIDENLIREQYKQTGNLIDKVSTIVETGKELGDKYLAVRTKETDNKRAVDEKDIDTRFKMFVWDRILMILLILLIVVLSFFGKFDNTIFGAILLIIGYLLRNELFGLRRKSES